MAVEILSPTEFPLDGDDPLAAAHRTINDYLLRIPAEGFVGTSTMYTHWPTVRALHREAASEVLRLPGDKQLDCIRASSRFSYWSRFEWGWSSYKPETQMQMGYENALNNLCAAILDFDREWSEEEIVEIVQIAVPYGFSKRDLISPLVEKHLENHSLLESLRHSVETVREWNSNIYRLPYWLRLGEALGESLILHRGEVWADDAVKFISEQDGNAREQWRLLLLHCVDSDKAKPSAKWLRRRRGILAKSGWRRLRVVSCAGAAIMVSQPRPTKSIRPLSKGWCGASRCFRARRVRGLCFRSRFRQFGLMP